MRYQARRPLPGFYATYNCYVWICRKLGSGAFVVGEKFCKDTFRFTRGEPKFRKSSQVAKRRYHADRGSRQINRPFNTDRIDGNAGSLDHPADFSPKYDSGIKINFNGSASTMTFHACAPGTGAIKDTNERPENALETEHLQRRY